MQYHDIVVVGNITKTIEKALCNEFYSTFFVKKSSRSYILGYQNKILVFRLKVKEVKEADLTRFESFVSTQKCKIIFSETYTQQSEEVDAYFFFLSSKKIVTAEEKSSFVQRIEDLIGCKIQSIEGVCYIKLSKEQISSIEITSQLLGLLLTRRFVDMLIQLNNPAIRKYSYGVRLSTHTA